jgi:hypothetical protein
MRNMKSRWHVFNFFLLLVATLTLTACSTSEERKKKKEFSNIRVHIEGDQSGDRSSAISVLRSAPIRINVEAEPILDEHNINNATLLEQADGTFAIQLEFDRRGGWILERTSVSHRGKHLAIFSYFGQGRWLAAPLITGKNSTGMLTFTPDATREETERIVRGLNNVIRKLQRKENWPFPATIDR